MKANLANVLIQKGHIGKGTEIEVNVRRQTMSPTSTTIPDRYIIKNINASTFSCIKSFGFEEINIRPEHIIKIEGMDPINYAQVYHIDDNGNLLDHGKKRGRKPKDGNRLT